MSSLECFAFFLEGGAVCDYILPLGIWWTELDSFEPKQTQEYSFMSSIKK